MVGPTYFTCTLGQAAELRDQKASEFKNINELIDLKAAKHPNGFAVGFPEVQSGSQSWGSQLFTFADLRNNSISVANQISPLFVDSKGASRCVALLCPSSVEFLFTWLGLMRSGVSVLLIAPQCQPEAIAHLCQSCHTSHIFYHEKYSALAISAKKESSFNLKGHNISSQLDFAKYKTEAGGTSQSVPQNYHHTPLYVPSEHDTAYIHHTSGTSSGLPKPIPQSHHAGVGVLPCIDGRDTATFTTTPLYHGGVADCFRSWTSDAMIWLFPGTDVPITTKNMLSCLDVAERACSQNSGIPKVKYFSSVPYILQMLADDQSGLVALQKMDLVGVGGAALPQKIGDQLVNENVNLLSRFGSAECGFLLSSHRDYKTDKDWQFLRLDPPSKFLQFEEQSDESGLSELVILPGWPHMAKTNRINGSFATSDLFEPHPHTAGAWKYHSRSDSQITLITGKKFDPAPLEDAIRTSHPCIKDVLVFGSGKQNPGALIFRSDKFDLSEENFEIDVSNSVQKINSAGQDHTRISNDMLVMMPPGSPVLERSSKGTILRRAAEERFSREIESAYQKIVVEDREELCSKTLSHRGLLTVIRNIITSVTSKNDVLGDSDDFYRNGFDSTQCTRIRALIEKTFRIALPWNIVYDCGNINNFAEYMTELGSGQKSEARESAEIEHMLKLVKGFSNFTPVEPPQELQNGSTVFSKVVVLTGATGALGAHALDTLRSDPSVCRVICLVRASGHEDAVRRVSKSLEQRGRQNLEDSTKCIECVPVVLSDTGLGLSKDLLDNVRQQATHFIHAAWTVNFSLPLKTFEDQISGVYNILNLAMSCARHPEVIFCSSTASVLGPDHPSLIEESISTSPHDADSLGYSRSKWVAEAVCSAASKEPTMKGRVKIVRIGQLTGDTENGIWNMAEAWPLMLSTVDELGCLPRVDEKLTWLPLNVAARAVVEISFHKPEGSETEHDFIYHVVNNSRETSWSDLLRWIQEERSGHFEVVEAEVWLQKLEELENHPAKNLIWMWRRAYGMGKVDNMRKNNTKKVTDIDFEVSHAREASQAMNIVKPVDQRLVGKIGQWLKRETSLRE